MHNGFSLLFSCAEEKPIYYEYNGTTITRIDNGNKIYFYYGKCDNPKLPCRNSYIKASYRGFDGAMSAYLKFDSSKVEMITVMGYFDEKGNNSNLYIEERLGIRFDSIFSLKNVIYVSETTDFEIKKNKQKGSEVIAVYPSSK